MNVTISLDHDLVKRLRKIAVERNTTVSGLVRGYLNQLALAEPASDRRCYDLRALEPSFEKDQFMVGKSTWHRADLHTRG